MIKINKTKEDDSKFEFLVIVNSGGETKHQVTVDKKYLKKLSAESSQSSVEDLIIKSFEFLLEREPNQAILKEFNLEIISSVRSKSFLNSAS